MFRDNRQVDISPRCDVDCCDMVGRIYDATRLTSKLISRWSICFRDLGVFGF